ncbi:MAG: hypothetical protein ACYDA8_22380, partial [Deferrisomatales bacterium]
GPAPATREAAEAEVARHGARLTAQLRAGACDPPGERHAAAWELLWRHTCRRLEVSNPKAVPPARH